MPLLTEQRNIRPPHLPPTVTARTTRVSNPVRSPSFRASASGTAQQVAFATGVPSDICAFHRYTASSTCLYRPQVNAVSDARSQLSRDFSHPTCVTAYAPFTPSESG